MKIYIIDKVWEWGVAPLRNPDGRVGMVGVGDVKMQIYANIQMEPGDESVNLDSIELVVKGSKNGKETQSSAVWNVGNKRSINLTEEIV